MTRWIVVPCAALVACAAAAPVPTERLAASEASYRGAQEAGADGAPQAKLHLKLAEDGIVSAKQLIAEKRNAEAALVLDRARADAELAVGLARQAKAEWEVQQLTQQLKTLQATP